MGGDGYSLDALTSAGMARGAELVCCDVVPARLVGIHSDDGKMSEFLHKHPGIVCLAMLVQPSSFVTCEPAKESHPNDHSNSTAAPTTARAHSSAAPVVGYLNVYQLHWDVEVAAAIKLEPQQIKLQYIPVSIVHIAIARNTGTSDANDACIDQKMERGDAVLVLASDGRLHGFTRWDGQTSRAEDRNSNMLLKEESWEMMKQYIPELAEIPFPVVNLAAELAVDQAGALRRTIIVGCTEGTLLFSTEIATGNRRVTHSSANGRVTAVGIDSSSYSESRGNNEIVTGLACSNHGSVACLNLAVEGPQDSAGGWTGAVRLADTANVMCMGFSNFRGDGLRSLVIGTSSGMIAIYDGSPEARVRQQVDERKDDVERSFGLEWPGADSSATESSQSQRNEIPSTRPYGSEWQRSTRWVHQQPKAKYMELKWLTHVPYPIWGITVGDFNHDGISEVVAVSMYAVHVFRPDYREEASKLFKTLTTLDRLQPPERDMIGSDNPVAADQSMRLKFHSGTGGASHH